jgi:pimeloyl-ACP methyl ester carboxylesterase
MIDPVQTRFSPRLETDGKKETIMPFVKANGVNLHYAFLGNGPDVIMIHGLAATLGFWYLQLAPMLQSHFRINMYDLRGHGHSELVPSGYTTEELARDLNALMEHLAIGRAHLVGHSFGGAVALHYATLFPDRVHTLTLADAYVPSLQPLARPRYPEYWQSRRKRLEGMGLSIPPEMPRVAYGLMEEMAREQREGGTDNESPEFASLGKQYMEGRTAKRWRALLEKTSAFQDILDKTILPEQRLRQIQIPVLALYGQYSHYLPIGIKLGRLLPRCTLRTIPGVGHFHPIVRPINFVDQLHRFLMHKSQNG